MCVCVCVCCLFKHVLNLVQYRFYCYNHSFTYLELNESIEALQQVNVTVVRLVVLTERLQRELDDITNQTIALQMDCLMNGTIPNVTCNMIPIQSYTVVVDYRAVSACVLCLCLCICVCVCTSMYVV